MEYRPITITDLLTETLKIFGNIYLPLLIIGFPALVLSVLPYSFTESTTKYDWLNWVLLILINPWLFGIRYFYVYQYLKESKITE